MKPFVNSVILGLLNPSHSWKIKKINFFKNPECRNIRRARMFSNWLNHSAWPISIFICILKDANIKDKRTSRWMCQSTKLWLLFLLLSSAFSLTGLFSDGPPPPQWNTCHFSGLSVSPQEPQIRMLLTNKDTRVSNSLLSVMNPQFYYCLLNDGLTHSRMECQFHSLLQWGMLRTVWCV